MTNDQSYVQVNDKGQATSFVGTDAVELFRIAAIASALGLFAKTGLKANRAYTLTNMLNAASAITGKRYKKNRDGASAAQADLKAHTATLKSALPYQNAAGQPV